MSDIGLYRVSDGTWWVRSGADLDTQLIHNYAYGGRAGDTPAVADYNGDGATDIALYRSSVGTWWARSGVNPASQLIGGYAYGGRSGDLPAPGDYNGDSVADLGLYRSSDGSWWARSGANLGTQLFADFPYGKRGRPARHLDPHPGHLTPRPAGRPSHRPAGPRVMTRRRAAGPAG